MIRPGTTGDLVVPADPRWVAVFLRGVVGRLWLLAVPVALGGAVSIVRGDPGPVLSSVVLVGVIVVLGVLAVLHQLAWRWATLTLTDTHLVLRLRGRRRAVARDDVAALVLGWFTERPDQTSQRQLVVADHDGRRRATSPEAVWDAADLRRLADELGVELRPADRHDRRLTPWWVRHPGRAAAGLLVGGVVAVVAVGAVVGSVRSAGAAADAASVAGSFRAWAVDVQRAQPALESAEVEVSPADAGADDLVEVEVVVVATSATGEADPALLATVVDSACTRATVLSADLGTAVPTRVRVTTALTDRPLLADGGRAERSVTVACDDGTAGSEPALAWLTHVAAHPFDPGVVMVSVQPPTAGSVQAYLRVLSPDDVDRAVEVGCATGAGADPGAAAAVTLLVRSDVADTEVVCADRVSP